MPQFLLRLVPPRPSFPFDMSEAEQAVMARHAAYWDDLTERGTCLIFGPVVDPDDPWGLAIVEAGSEAEARAIFDADPAVSSATCTARLAPIHVARMRAERN